MVVHFSYRPLEATIEENISNNTKKKKKRKQSYFHLSSKFDKKINKNKLQTIKELQFNKLNI